MVTPPSSTVRDEPLLLLNSTPISEVNPHARTPPPCCPVSSTSSGYLPFSTLETECVNRCTADCPPSSSEAAFRTYLPTPRSKARRDPRSSVIRTWYLRSRIKNPVQVEAPLPSNASPEQSRTACVAPSSWTKQLAPPPNAAHVQ